LTIPRFVSRGLHFTNAVKAGYPPSTVRWVDAEDGATAVWWAKFGEFAPIEGLRHVPLSEASLRILCPNGHLGFAPIKTASFQIGLDCAPDLICVDSGSCDVGPGPLGAEACRWRRASLWAAADPRARHTNTLSFRESVKELPNAGG
jgi:hypothetical protein